eukprot:TRINITY_DN3190_c0_g1_i1.p1 TRINITY_DN3190_c0_g1~~TRINITY_DN3190_c0_g1_i1.p1  ORF type:complete len:224 (-),score=19.02 TRINITY_DN3190_c0_g1_i1:60-731(-)
MSPLHLFILLTTCVYFMTVNGVSLNAGGETTISGGLIVDGQNTDTRISSLESDLATATENLVAAETKITNLENSLADLKGMQQLTKVNTTAGNTFYVGLTDPMTWTQADIFCKAKGLRLAIIRTLADTVDIHTFVTAQKKLWLDFKADSSSYNFKVTFTGETFSTGGPGASAATVGSGFESGLWWSTQPNCQGCNIMLHYGAYDNLFTDDANSVLATPLCMKF